LRSTTFKKLICVALFLSSPVAVQAQATADAVVTLRSVVSPDTMTVGDPVQLTVYITLGPRTQVETIRSPFAGTPQFELADVQDSTLRTGNAAIRKLVFTAIPFETGVFVTDSIVVLYRTAGDTVAKKLSFPGSLIVVKSVLDQDADDIKPEKQPFAFEFSDQLILLTVLILLALIGIIIVTVLFWRKRRRIHPAIAEEPVFPERPPAETALEALQTLRASSLLAENRFKEFHTKASEILRIYIEDQFRVEALEMTTPQLLSNLRSFEMQNELVALAARFLESCDLVKFAKHVPTPSQSDETLTLGISFVSKTSESSSDSSVSSTGEDESKR